MGGLHSGKVCFGDFRFLAQCINLNCADVVVELRSRFPVGFIKFESHLCRGVWVRGVGAIRRASAEEKTTHGSRTQRRKAVLGMRLEKLGYGDGSRTVLREIRSARAEATRTP